MRLRVDDAATEVFALCTVLISDLISAQSESKVSGCFELGDECRCHSCFFYRGNTLFADLATLKRTFSLDKRSLPILKNVSKAKLVEEQSESGSSRVDEATLFERCLSKREKKRRKVFNVENVENTEVYL